MDEGMDSRRGAPHMGGSCWSSADMHHQPSSSGGSSGSNSNSRLTRLEEAGESWSARVCNQEAGKSPESSRPSARKPSQMSPKLVAARSSGSRRVQRPHHESLQGQWNVLQSFGGSLNETESESVGMDAEANFAMGLSTQLGLSQEDNILPGHGHPCSSTDSLLEMGGRSVNSSLDFLAGRVPVGLSSTSEFFLGSSGGHVMENVGSRSAGLPPVGDRQALAGPSSAYHGGRNGSDEGRVGEVGGSMTSHSLFMDQQGLDDQAYHSSSSNFSGPTEAFSSGAIRSEGLYNSQAACSSDAHHYVSDGPSLRGSFLGSLENAAGSRSNPSSSSRSSSCKRKSCTPGVAGSLFCRNGSPHPSAFRENYGGIFGGSSLSRHSTGIPGCTSASDVVPSLSMSGEATPLHRGGELPAMANGLEEPWTSRGLSMREAVDAEAVQDGRPGKAVVGSAGAGSSSQRNIRGGAVGVVLLEQGASQAPQFARTVRRAMPVLQPESWSAGRASPAECSMDADESNSSSNLLYDRVLADRRGGSSLIGSGRSGSSSSLRRRDASFGSTSIGERFSHRYMGSSTRSLVTSASSANQLGAAVATESRLRNRGINPNNLDPTSSLISPLLADPVSSSLPTVANSAATSGPSPSRPPPHPPVLRSRSQGSSVHTLLPTLSSSGPAPSRIPPSPPSVSSSFATSMDTLPSPASLFPGSLLPRGSSVRVRSERGLSAAAESLLGMPFRGLQLSAGDGPHQPRLVAEGLAEILLALERVERDEDLTYEQLLMLEATLLFGGMGLHDQHSDLRLDVDNMSYEELLALGERIGNVSTGVSTEMLMHRLKRSFYYSLDVVATHLSQECDIKCSICQEEYKEGDELGKIDCGHGYHVLCIEQWLVQKNQCPICKAAAFS